MCNSKNPVFLQEFHLTVLPQRHCSQKKNELVYQYQILVLSIINTKDWGSLVKWLILGLSGKTTR